MKQPKPPACLMATVMLLAVIIFAQAHAATMSASATAPAIDGRDIANYAAVTGNDKWFAENSPAGAVKGQTFTTGNGAVLLKSITYQVTASQKAEPTKQYVIRLGTVAGTTFTPVYTETATQSFTWSGGHFMTWTFDNPPLLKGNTVYGVDIGMSSSSSTWQTGIPYINVTANDYPAGQRYSSGTSGVGTSSLTVVTSSDRIFHLDLETPLGATLELVATDPADGATEVLASRPLTLTFSQNIAPGEGNILIRNLSDNTEIAIPAGASALSYSENLLTVSPAGGLLWSRNYAVRIEPGAIENTTGSPFPGITDDSTWNFTTADGDPLLDAIAQLKAHIRGTTTLSTAQISAYKETIDNLRDQFDDTAVNIAAVFDLVTTYDTVKGPLWVARGEFNRTTQTNDLDWTIYHVMQYVMDGVYNAANLTNHESLLNGFKFGSSANFPGPCPPPTPGATHTATLNASFPATFGRITQGDDLPARKPTGCYLAPGTIASVTVPPALVGQGFKVRVGAHSWDLSHRPPVRRLDRATLLYDLNTATIKIASPYGGGIYIEVPRLANAGIVQVTIQGAARSPYFSAKSFHQTTAADWETERAHPAPWADFQSDKFMMQVPSKWINAHPDPAKLMADWDKAMDIQNDLMGFPRLRGKETQYPQVDVLMRSSVHAPGYPSVNNVDNPNNNRGGYHNNYLVRGPGANYHSTDTEFHEQGHAYFFPKFGGETESNVNLPHVAILHRGFGYTLDEAFRGSRGSTRTFQTLDTTATAWMCVFNFAPRRVPMAEAEKAYQLKGHAKFVDIARLYGWDVLGDYWRSFMEDNANGVSYSTATDALLLRLCRSVGKDIRPLLHFWGIHPQNNTSLAASLAAENIPLDPSIRDRLLHYRSLVPANNADFRTFATAWWGKQPNFSTGAWEEREHARQWDTTALYGAGDQQRTDATNPGEIYNENSAADIRTRVDELLDLYFPDTIAPKPISFASTPAAVNGSTITMTAATAASNAGRIEYQFENTTSQSNSGWTPSQLWQATGLSAGRSYAFRVKARDALGHETGWSAEVSATTTPNNSPFETWADSFQSLADSSPSLDSDRGGLATGIEWVLGGDPSNPADDATLAPAFANAADPDGRSLFTFRRSAAAGADSDTAISVEYGNSLGGWTTAVHQGNGPADITITETPGHFGPGIDRVTVALPAALAVKGRLFARLKVTVSQP